MAEVDLATLDALGNRKFYFAYGWERLEDGSFHIWQYSAGESLQTVWDEFGFVVLKSWIDYKLYVAHWVIQPTQFLEYALRKLVHPGQQTKRLSSGE